MNSWKMPVACAMAALLTMLMLCGGCEQDDAWSSGFSRSPHAPRFDRTASVEFREVPVSDVKGLLDEQNARLKSLNRAPEDSTKEDGRVFREAMVRWFRLPYAPDSLVIIGTTAFRTEGGVNPRSDYLKALANREGANLAIVSVESAGRVESFRRVYTPVFSTASAQATYSDNRGYRGQGAATAQGWSHTSQVVPYTTEAFDVHALLLRVLTPDEIAARAAGVPPWQ